MGVSPILAQTFTEPFIVYSAKRFPGVPGAPSSLYMTMSVNLRLMTYRHNRPLYRSG